MFKNRDSEINSFETQVIENVFRNCHLHTKDKVNIYSTFAGEGSSDIEYLLRLENKIDIAFHAHKESFRGQESYSQLYDTEYFKKDIKVKENSYQNLPNPLDLPKELYPLKILKIFSRVYIKNSYRNYDGYKSICEYNFWLNYRTKTYEGFFGETTDYSNKWDEKLILEFNKVGKEFIKKTFLGIKKISKKVKFADHEKELKKFEKFSK